MEKITIAKAKRLELGLTITDVADLIEWQSPNISRIERGLQKPSPERAAQLAKVLGVDEIVFFYPERYMVEPDKPKLMERLRAEMTAE